MRDVPARAVARWEALLPPARDGEPIPHILHQTYRGRELPPLLERTTGELRRRNPDWDYRFYDDAEVDRFVRDHFAPAVYRQFARIAPSYGVVRADLFRYMAVLVHGGAYLDIKSTAERPLSEAIAGDEGFVLSHWDNRPGEPHAGWGQHPELADQPRGEIQQWHVIAAPGHPFLRRVIATVLARIEAYRPWRDNVGWLGVITLTGPIMYTRAIAPILPLHRYVAVPDHTHLGLVYSVTEGEGHKSFFQGHYVENPRPIVRLPFPLEPAGRAYAALRRRMRAWRGKGVSER